MIRNIFKARFKNLELRWAKTSSKRYVAFLRRKGCSIGENIVFFGNLKSISIDITRPSLISIGNNVSFNANCCLVTHDFATWCFRYKYNEFINSSGAICIGNNVGFGRNVTVLKGVSIGDNSFIGTHSVVTKDIPTNSVAAGNPAKVVCTIDEYYEKRKEKSILEALDYARSIQDKFGRRPVIEDFWEEFPLFVNGYEIDLYPTLPIKNQLGNALDKWSINHKAVFNSFDDFLIAAGL